MKKSAGFALFSKILTLIVGHSPTSGFGNLLQENQKEAYTVFFKHA
jgi:hypothetical protein